MPLPFFYNESITTGIREFEMNEDASRHIVQVLRMKANEQLMITDGKGNMNTAVIISDHKKKCIVEILNTTHTAPQSQKTTIAISLVKNAARFEWFLEKATEIGITEVVPLICSRTEKQHFRLDRMKNILVSAMLQSQQAWLPHLHEPVKFLDYIKQSSLQNKEKFIAHCEDEQNKKTLSSIPSKNDQLILIGPEGDFTKEEIDSAIQLDFIPVSLGNTRLRTETAGMVAAVLLASK